MSRKRNAPIEEDLADIEFETSDNIKIFPTFDSLKLDEDLLRGIYSYGIVNISIIIIFF